jgi:steroid delta-isomerase-like uncharacterized protein
VFARPGTSDANIQTVRDGIAALSRGDVEACVAMLDPDFVINIAGMPYPKKGPDAWRANARTMLSAFPDVRIHAEEFVAANDMVAVRARVTGTHTGEFLGTAPSGRRIDYLSHEFYRIKDGKIAEEWICSDTLTLLAQIDASQGRRLLFMWLSGFRTWVSAFAGFLAGALAVLMLQFVLP